MPGGGPSAMGHLRHGPLGGGQTCPTPADFSDAEPLLYQLLDPVVEDMSPVEAERYRAALTTLRERTDGRARARLRETLGLASYRLDAWITASPPASSRRRAAGRERSRSAASAGSRGLPGCCGARESEGFIHAPSLAHAATAAVLRAGTTRMAPTTPGR